MPTTRNRFIGLWLILASFMQCASPADQQAQADRAGRLIAILYQTSGVDTSLRYLSNYFGAKEAEPNFAWPDSSAKGTALYFRPGQAQLVFSPAIGAPPGPNLPPSFGIWWLALRTPQLDPALADLRNKGISLAEERLYLPAGRLSKAAMVLMPDYQRLVLVERREAVSLNGYAIDHLQLLVEDIRANVKFFKEVLGAEVMLKDDRGTVLYVGGQMIVLSEPEGLGLAPAQVAQFRPHLNRFGVNRLIFQYDSLPAALAWAEKKGWAFYQEPRQNGKWAYLYTPDSLRCDLIDMSVKSTDLP